MIMMMDKKKIVSQIMGDEGERETSPLLAIMQEFIHCIESGDAEGAAECFKSAMAHCSQPTEG